MTGRERTALQEAARAIANLHCEANIELLQRTRRIVRERALAFERQRQRQRNQAGLAMACALAVVLLLAPAIWNGILDLLGGEHFADLPTQAALLLLMLSPAMLAALIAILKEPRGLDGREL